MKNIILSGSGDFDPIGQNDTIKDIFNVVKDFFNWAMIIVFAGFIIMGLVQMSLAKRNDDSAKNDKGKGYLINAMLLLGVIVVVNAILTIIGI